MKTTAIDDNPRRTFTALAEFERNNEDKENGGWVTFDCFTYPSSYLIPGELELLALRAPFHSIARFLSLEDSDSQWLKIEVGAHATTDSVPMQVILFGDNTERVTLHLLNASPVRLSIDAFERFMLAHEDRVPKTLISTILDLSLRNAGTLAVAAYDVGQGNCNAIVDQYEHPRVFFDLGWAPNFHATSRPPCQPRLFDCDPITVAPVVLSHWDMDHWSYAIARSDFDPASLTTRHQWNPQALQRFWIARAPEIDKHAIGPLARSFFDALSNVRLMPGVGAMLLWPDGCDRITFAHGWLEACGRTPGAVQDRNNTGIALFVQPHLRGPAILLTGDADFVSIPGLAKKTTPRLAGMVAPHHGSDVTTTAIPAPRADSPAKMVISVGRDNTYGHAKQVALDAYKAAGWALAMALTQTVIPAPRTTSEHRTSTAITCSSSRMPMPIPDAAANGSSMPICA